MAKWMDSVFGGSGRAVSPKKGRGGGSGAGIDAALSVNELRQAFENLRVVLLEMLDAQARGQPLNLTSPALRQFLHLSETADAEQALLRLREINAPIVGQVACGECSAVIDRRAGLEAVVCAWCGATVTFEEITPAADAPTPESDL